MPSLLSRTRPNPTHSNKDAATSPDSQPLSASEQPLVAMHACLDGARALEKSAVELDGAIQARDAALSKAAALTKQKTEAANTQHKKRVNNADAIKANAEQAIATEKSQVEAMITPIEGRFKWFSYDLSDVTVSPHSGPQIAEQIRAAFAVATENESTIASYEKNGGTWIVGILALFFVILVSVVNLAQSVVGGLILSCACLGIPIYYYVTAVKNFHASRDELLALIKSLKKRNLWEGEQALANAKAAHKKTGEDNETQHKRELQNIESENNSATTQIKTNFESKKSALTESVNARFEALQCNIGAIDQGLARGNWHDSAWDNWEPTQSAPGCLRIGTLQPQTPRFRGHFPQLAPIQIPALVDYEAGKGLVIYAEGALDDARQMAQSAITRLLGTVPPAGVKFVFLDPVSLGGNVAGFMKLEKYEASLIGGKAWSDARHIETALAEVTDHMETVIQKYLREDYKSIAAYNAKARVKEAYRIVVAFDFPVNFSETSAKRLNSIMRNGPRCGVFPIVIVDRSKPMPYGINLEDLEAHALVIQARR